jgi:hypothetical protein
LAIGGQFFAQDAALVGQAINNGMTTMISDGSYELLLSTEVQPLRSLNAPQWVLFVMENVTSRELNRK